jgi:hypothetical protein
MNGTNQKVYLYVKQVSALVDACEDYSCFGEVIFFCHVEGFKMEQRAAIKFCVRLRN